MKTVIFCGGKGTRLREETEFRPKPLVEIGGIPILVHIMNHYSSFGYNEFILCLGYKGDMIKDYFLNFEYTEDFELALGKKSVNKLTSAESPEWNIIFANTGSNAMTGSRLKQVQRYIKDENFFVTYGDGVSNVDLKDLLSFHQKHGKVGTVTTVRPRTRFGRLTLGGDNDVLSNEKKTTVHDGWIDGGFFVFNKKIFDYISKDDACELEAHGINALAADGQLRAYKHDGFWQCMDTMRDVELLNSLWDHDKKQWKI